jgi:transcription elongation GreA/GreB family factor
MALFRRKQPTAAELLEQRAQLVAELEAIDADAAWAAASDDRAELADAAQLRRQADALRRSIADLDARLRNV